MHIQTRFATILLTILCCITLFCQKTSKSPVVARVGDAVLTQKNLVDLLPNGYSSTITRDQKITIVKQWIDNQLLLQEAMRQNIDKDSSFIARVTKMRHDLLCAEIISRSSVTQEVKSVTNEQLLAYYEKNSSQFIRDTDVIKFCEIFLPDMKTAWTVRNQVTPDNFYQLAAKYSKSRVCDPDSALFVALGDLPEGIRSVVSQIRVDGTTSPIPTSEGVSVFRILDKQKKGSVKSFAECKELIRAELITPDQKSGMETLLARLRMKTSVEFDFAGIPGSSYEAQSEITDSIPVQQAIIDTVPQ